MPSTGFDPTIVQGERPLTHASDRAATGIGDVTVPKKVTKAFRVMSPSNVTSNVTKSCHQVMSPSHVTSNVTKSCHQVMSPSHVTK